ncbi:SH3 domain-containing protein [Halovulum sp. GXIMD14794]
MLRITALTLAVLTAAPAISQQLDVPITIPPGDGQAGDCATSTVSGLDPNGDGFLSVRSGPGTEFRKMDELHNGDVVATCQKSGPWHGVLYDGRNRRGWVHGNWLTDLAG